MSQLPTERPISQLPLRPTAAQAPGFAQPLQHAWRRLRARTQGQHRLHTLYLARDEVLAWSHAGHGAALGKPTAHGAASVKPVAFADFDAWCAAHAHSDARIFVSAHLLHSLVVDPALNLHEDDALRAYAQQQFGHYHGAAARQWPLAVWSHRSKQGTQAVACALHGVNMAALKASAHHHGVRLRSVSPVWSAGLNSVNSRWPADAGQKTRHAVALIEGRLLTWMLLQGGALLSLEQRYLDASDSSDGSAALRLIAQLSSDSGPLSASPAVLAWGLPLDDSRQTGTPAGLHALHTHDHHSALNAWVMDAAGSIS